MIPNRGSDDDDGRRRKEMKKRMRKKSEREIESEKEDSRSRVIMEGKLGRVTTDYDEKKRKRAGLAARCYY